ncbi:MAG: dihydrofolate reductase [Cyclobacteriaceae bacterium]
MNLKTILPMALICAIVISCEQPQKEKQPIPLVGDTTNFEWRTEQFADLKIVRYQVGGWEKLTADQRKLVYYLTQAGLEGRDIMWDMNYRHNLTIRQALENIVRNYNGDKNSDDWNNFMVYMKRIWFSNGIHHHYSMNKIMPEFSREYLEGLLSETNTELSTEIVDILFDPEKDAKKVNLDSNDDLILTSAVNFYGPDITQAEVEAFYSEKIDKSDDTPISYGLNSKLIRNEDGSLSEDVYKVDGRYGEALKKMISWLEKAVIVAENQAQGDALKLLIEYFQTGDLAKWDEYNIAWSQATDGDIDYIMGFVEVYNDPLAYRGSYETIVQVNDFEASARMKVLMDNAQWFEDKSTLLPQHKKENVVGVTYKVVNVAGKSGDASPSCPVGVNLPNANWIRSTYGSKSVSLGNIVAGYANGGGGGFADEFLLEEVRERYEEHGGLSGKMQTALHEVIGHASGKLELGVATPKETLKNYRSALEEARADLVGLYYQLDEKLIELGLYPSIEAGKSRYDFYITNGLVYQLRRLKLGEVIEESHMRNRAMVAGWAYEKGKDDNVMEKVVQDGKTYYKVNDYEKLRELFGQLLREVQRIKSQGDYEAGKALIETYGVQVDPELHAEVLERAEKLGSAPYSGLINPLLIPIEENGEIMDVRMEYPDDFMKQMLRYSEDYGNL